MTFLQPLMLIGIPLVVIPIVIHLINQWRYQTRRWGAMMFLLSANRMNRGYAKLRQWLILAMRVLVIAGLIFAASRPLASGLLGLTGGGRVDTTLVLLDRSPSMQQQGSGGQSKLETGRRQLASALATLGSGQWVLIDSNKVQPQRFDNLDALVQSPETGGSSATASVPQMLSAVGDYLVTNKPGPTDVWICSDLRASDWLPSSSLWTSARETISSYPQSVKLHLVTYPAAPSDNLVLRVTEVRRDSSNENPALLISFQIINQALKEGASQSRSVPLQIEVDGARSETQVEMTGRDLQTRNFRVPLASQQTRGWGKLSLPADQNNSDNVYYFVYDEEQVRRVVIVSDDRDATRPLELAAAIAPDGGSSTQVDVIVPEQVDSSLLDSAALLLWHAALPQDAMAKAVENYVASGGQVIFFPPTVLVNNVSVDQSFLGVSWKSWQQLDSQSDRLQVDNWRGDQDLLAATRSGAGLPVGQLELSGYATLAGEHSALAAFKNGAPLLARIATDKGGVYFCTTSPNPELSSLATNGVVLYVIVQRALEQGQKSLGNTMEQTAGTVEGTTENWRLVSIGGEDGTTAQLSSQYAWQAGVYNNQGRFLAINRGMSEDQVDVIEDKQLDQLLAGLNYSRLDDQAGNLSGIVREIWQLFLLLMIVAMLLEAVLCLPRRDKVASVSLSKAFTTS